MINGPRIQDSVTHADINRTTEAGETESMSDRSEPAQGLMQRLYADMERLFPGAGAAEDTALDTTVPAARGGAFDSDAGEPQPRRQAKICRLLNQSLADCVDLERRAIHASWNIKDADAIALRPWLQEINKVAALKSERIAERITELGGVAEATVAAVADRSGLSEYSLAIRRGEGHVVAVSAALALVVDALAEDIEILSGHNDVRSQRILKDTVQELSRRAP